MNKSRSELEQMASTAPASHTVNAVPHQRRCATLFQPQAGALWAGSQPSPWPQRKNLGHSTHVCHRHIGRRRETESRPPYPQEKQRTRAAQQPFLLFATTRT